MPWAGTQTEQDIEYLNSSNWTYLKREKSCSKTSLRVRKQLLYRRDMIMRNRTLAQSHSNNLYFFCLIFQEQISKSFHHNLLDLSRMFSLDKDEPKVRNMFEYRSNDGADDWINF